MRFLMCFNKIPWSQTFKLDCKIVQDESSSRSGNGSGSGSGSGNKLAGPRRDLYVT